jgi:hypothetical protein
MRRFLRILLNAATVASLLLALAATLAFVGSEPPGDRPWRWTRDGVGRPWTVLTVAKTQVRLERYHPAGPGIAPGDARLYGRLGRRVSVAAAGFEFNNDGCVVVDLASGAAPQTFAGFDVAVPLWTIFLLALAVPAARLAAYVRRARRARQPGLCTCCGYDLRATPERCPECGTIPAR